MAITPNPPGPRRATLSGSPVAISCSALASTLHVRIESSISSLARDAAKALISLGHTATPVEKPVRACTLRHRIAKLSPEIEAIIACMRPFRLEPEYVPTLDVDVVLSLGDPDSKPISKWKLRVRSESRAFATSLGDAYAGLGCTLSSSSGVVPFVLRPTMRYGGANAFARNVVAWTYIQRGGELPDQIKAWGDDDHDIYLDCPPPGGAAIPLRQRIPIAVRIDTPGAFTAIAPRLREAGFSRVTMQSLEVNDGTRLRLDIGALRVAEAYLEVADITRALADAAQMLEIDWASYPLEVADRSSDTDSGVVIDMPAAAIRRGRLPPWSKIHPARYEVVIHDDHREAGCDLIDRLKLLGFRASRNRLKSISAGFIIRCGKAVPASVREKVASVVDAAMLRLGAGAMVLGNIGCDGETIEIELPAGAHRDGRLLKELTNPARHDVRVIAPSEDVARPLLEKLRSWGCRNARIEVDTDDDPAELRYGSAHPLMLDRIDGEINGLYGPLVLTRNKAWPVTDHDIVIRLPKTARIRTPATSPSTNARGTPPISPRSKLLMLIRNHHPSRPPLVQVTGTEVRIADVILRRGSTEERHPRAMSPDRFHGFCADQAVANTLYYLARTIRGAYPVALEGPTAASKTWSIHYLASLLGIGVYRLNLNGQSDVSEVMGRFVPDTERAGAFRWQHGPAPLAMLEGAWLVLDECDLAPTEILERCNPILETPDPVLNLSEYDGRVIRNADGRFRMLATWNGLGYSGRQVLSAAFLDRFKTRVCEAPSEVDYRFLGECLVRGNQPDVIINEARFRGGATRPMLPELAVLMPEIDRFLVAFARFHAGLASMAERGELRTRGRIAYTRRAFVDALREMRDNLVLAGDPRPSRGALIRAAWQAISLCHLERLNPEGEREKAVTLLAACGIGPGSWDLPR